MYKVFYKTFSGEIENVKLGSKNKDMAMSLAYEQIEDCEEILNVEEI